MIKNTLVTLLIFITIGLTNTHAGWYECYNFKGTIDKLPISLFIQVREGYFGEVDKKEFNIIGIYKNDKDNNPTRLEGKLNLSNNKVLLYEINNNKHTATFEFEFSKSECNGFWKNLSTNQKLPLQLVYNSLLIDTLKDSKFEEIEILQANSLKDYYFVGLYSKKTDQDKAQMDRLNIISKKDNSVFQSIDFSIVETQTGNLSTIIFDNVEIDDSKERGFTVLNDIGRGGGYLMVSFNPKTNNFKLNPKPIIEGQN